MQAKRYAVQPPVRIALRGAGKDVRELSPAEAEAWHACRAEAAEGEADRAFHREELRRHAAWPAPPLAAAA